MRKLSGENLSNLPKFTRLVTTESGLLPRHTPALADVGHDPSGSLAQS